MANRTRDLPDGWEKVRDVKVLGVPCLLEKHPRTGLFAVTSDFVRGLLCIRHSEDDVLKEAPVLLAAIRGGGSGIDLGTTTI